jgi:hypothetical protein
LEEVVHDILGTLDGTGEQKDDLDDLTIFGDHGVKGLSFTFDAIFLVPGVEVLGATKHSGSGLVNRFLNITKIRLQLDILVIQINIDLEERILSVSTSSSGLSYNTIIHGVQRVLCGIQEGLIKIPEVVSLDLLGLFTMNVLLVLNDMGIKFVEHYGVDQVINGSLNFFVLRHKEVGVLGDVIFLTLDELLKGHGLGVVGEVDKEDLGDLLEVVLDTVLDDVVDRDDELVEFVETLVNVLEVGVDVHGGPGKGDHTGSELELKIFKMWLKKVLGDWLDLA